MADNIQHIVGCPSCGGASQYRGVNISEERRFEEIIPPEQQMQGGDVLEQQIGKNFYDRYGLNSNKGYGGSNTIIWIILIIIVLIIIGAIFMRNKSTPARRR